VAQQLGNMGQRNATTRQTKSWKCVCEILVAKQHDC
jgi:hypothetical protein